MLFFQKFRKIFEIFRDIKRAFHVWRKYLLFVWHVLGSKTLFVIKQTSNLFTLLKRKLYCVCLFGTKIVISKRMKIVFLRRLPQMLICVHWFYFHNFFFLHIIEKKKLKSKQQKQEKKSCFCCVISKRDS